MPGLALPKPFFSPSLTPTTCLTRSFLEICIFRCERGLRIYSQDIGVKRLIGFGIEVDAGGLTDLDVANFALREHSREDRSSSGRESVTTGVPADSISPGSAVRVTMVPSNGAVILRSLRLPVASSNCALAFCSSATALAISAFLLGDLLTDHGKLHGTNIGISQAGLRHGERSLCRVHAPFGGGDRSGLRIGGGLSLLALPLGDRSGLDKPCVGVSIESGELIGRLLLRELRFGSGEFGLGLLHAAFGIGFGLAFLDAALAELFVENGDLTGGRNAGEPPLARDRRGPDLRGHGPACRPGRQSHRRPSSGRPRGSSPRAGGRWSCRQPPNRRLRCGRLEQ